VLLLNMFSNRYIYNNMHIAMKFIILVIVLTTIFIVYNLLKTRHSIKKQAEIELRKKEGFATINDMENRDYPISIQPLQSKYSKLYLRDFVIKSSYNSAQFNDTDTDVDAISAVLKRGCRLLDFKVNSDLKVGTIPLTDIFSRVSSQAFTTFSPSPYTPLFIYLRSDSETTINTSTLNALLIQNFPTTLYKDTDDKAIKVTGSTKLSDIMGKVVIISRIPRGVFTNIKIGDITYGIVESTAANFTGQTDKVLIKGDKISTTIKTFNLVVPDTEQTNIDSSSILNDGYPQFILYKFYEGGSKNLDNYEDIFNDAQSSFVPISYLIRNSTVDTDTIKKQESKIKSAVPSKPAAALGNGWFK
jgi:hypothetical protein